MDEAALERHLGPERCACPSPVLDGPDAAQEEARYLWLALVVGQPERWLRKQRDRLRRAGAEAADATGSTELGGSAWEEELGRKQDQLAVLDAELECRELQRKQRGLSQEALAAHREELWAIHQEWRSG